LCAVRGEGQTHGQSRREQSDVHIAPFVLYPRMSRMLFLNRLFATEVPALQFAFGLEPILQIAARLFATFQINFVCAASDFRFGHWIHNLSGSYFGFCVCVSRCFP
jgi:hypothetical protein